MLKTVQSILLGVVLATLPLAAMARPQVELSMSAEKAVTVEENGEKRTKWVPADSAAPGDQILYTLTYSNKGDEAATNVVVDNPIPQDTVYIVDSAAGDGADIAFSIDAGKTYKKPSLLTYEVVVDGKPEERKATPDSYTNVRWVIQRIDAGAEGTLKYSVKLK